MEFKNVAKPLSEIAKNYQYHEPPSFVLTIQEWITNLLRAVLDLLRLLRIRIPEGSDTRLVGNFMQSLIIAVGVVAVFVIILVVANKLKHIQAAKALARGGMIVEESALTASGWKDLALEMGTQKRYREACRAVYMSGLHFLDETAIADFNPTRTNYEYFYLLKKNKYLAEPFRALVDRVETIWFGFGEARENDLAFCLDKLKELEESSPTKMLAASAGDAN